MPSPVKCLLVDDLEENLLALAALLRQDDVEILQARNGTEALELLLLHDVALAFLDVQMPDMGGFELAELMRGSDRTRHVPIIFVTAGARDQHRMFKGYETGAVDFLFKPIDPHILKNKADVFFLLQRQKQRLAEELHDRTETLRFNEMFTAMLGHDLRTPLNTIVLSAELLQRRGADAATQDVAARVLASSLRMSRLIETLLDLARARLGGGIPVSPRPTELSTLVQRVVQEHTEAFAQGRIKVQAQGDLTGEWDTDRLAQVASNLIGNALQHGQGDQSVQVLLDGSDADRVTLSVSNPGSIPLEDLPQLFNPFRGTQRNARRYNGLGLGLYIVQQIVQAHGGSVEVGTGDGTQVRFDVRIPRKAGGAGTDQHSRAG